MEDEEGTAEPRRMRAFALAAAIAAAVYAFPLPGLSEEGRRLAAVMAFVATLWVTEVVPLAATAILGPALAVLVGVAPVKNAYAALANPIVVLFIGSFLIARALEKHRMSERIAYRVLGLGAVRSDPLRAFVFLGLVTAFISAWISNTATVAMMIPIAQSVLLAVSPRAAGGAADTTRSPRFAAALMLLIAYAASLGGLFTPIGTPPNLIGIGLIEQATGVRVSFGTWIVRCLPVTLATLLLMMAFMAWRFRGELGALVFDRGQMVARYAALGPWTAGQMLSGGALLLAFAGWLAPSLAGFWDEGWQKLLETRIPEGTVPLLAVAPLFLLYDRSGPERRAVLELADLRAIDWGTILLFAGGMCLGDLMMQTGVARAIGDAAAGHVPSGGMLAFLAAVFAIGTSELTSNTASANMVVPVVIAVAQQSGADPLIPALAATVACTFGFMLPVSTPTNAMAYATGYVKQRDMIRTGVVLDVLGAILLGLWFGWVL
jgi:sodium-dependent dicarboxylate transporter 2/3/5